MCFDCIVSKGLSWMVRIFVLKVDLRFEFSDACMYFHCTFPTHLPSCRMKFFLTCLSLHLAHHMFIRRIDWIYCPRISTDDKQCTTSAEWSSLLEPIFLALFLYMGKVACMISIGSSNLFGAPWAGILSSMSFSRTHRTHIIMGRSWFSSGSTITANSYGICRYHGIVRWILSVQVERPNASHVEQFSL
jgi:hypothetical protein